ncbi:Si:ch211198n511, partial [Caligus rogercresseyi]
LSSPDCQKGAHFMQLCETRNLPLIFFQNGGSADPALLSSSLSSTLKDRAKFVAAQSTLSVPKISINIRGVSGDENYTLCGPSFGPRFYFSWPNASISKSSAFSLQESKEIDAKTRNKISQFTFPRNSAQFAASRLTNDGIILPSRPGMSLERSFTSYSDLKTYP